MAIFKCKMCGGALEISQDQSTAICEYCGTAQTLPRLENDRKANLYDRANHFRRNNEFDKAVAIYENILNEDSTDAEVYWSLVLCRYGIEYVEDPATRKRVPTVNRTQFTSVFDDDNYKSALRYADLQQRGIYEAEANTINEIQKGILAISQKEEPFDIFICYKETDSNGRRTPDSVLANDLYYQLTAEGFKVFFSRITLEDKLGVAYEPYIFAALNSARVMVVIGTRPEYFQAVWVKNEWSRYLALMKQSGGSRILVPAYRDMDPYDLPEEFSHLQAQDMGKLGFMQDLIRGVKKLVAPEVAAPAVTVTPSAPASGSVAPLLRRVSLYLEDQEWSSADEYCEKVLDIDPENAEAYLGKLMVELKCSTREELANFPRDFSDSFYYGKVLRFADPEFSQTVADWNAQAAQRQEQARQQAIFDQAMTKMHRATDELSFLRLVDTFKTIPDFPGAAEMQEKCREEAEVCRKNAIYSQAKSNDGLRNIPALKKAAALYEQIPGWKDADSRLEKCNAFIREIEAADEAYVLAVLKAEKKRKITRGIVAGVAVATLIFLAVLFAEIIPGKTYKEGVAFMEQGDYVSAYNAFLEVNHYKDSAQKLESCRATIQSQAAACMENREYRKAIDMYTAISEVDSAMAACNQELQKYLITEPDLKKAEEVLDVATEKQLSLVMTGEQQSAYADLILGQVALSNPPHYYDLRPAAEKLRNLSSYKAARIVDFYDRLKACHEAFSFRDTFINYLYTFKSDWQNDILQKILLSDYYISYFMYGKWTDPNNSKNYLEFSRSDANDETMHCTYGLSYPSKKHAYWDIQNMEFVFLDEDKDVIAQVYKFEFVSANEMKVYCYNNKKTYTLKRPAY